MEYYSKGKPTQVIFRELCKHEGLNFPRMESVCGFRHTPRENKTCMDTTANTKLRARDGLENKSYRGIN